MCFLAQVEALQIVETSLVNIVQRHVHIVRTFSKGRTVIITVSDDIDGITVLAVSQ